jgi:PadR family transcriptional regulator PadR
MGPIPPSRAGSSPISTSRGQDRDNHQIRLAITPSVVCDASKGISQDAIQVYFPESVRDTSHRTQSGVELSPIEVRVEFRAPRMMRNQQFSSDMLKGTLDMHSPPATFTAVPSRRSSSAPPKTSSESSRARYPALHRLENRGWLASYRGASENNRKARYYRLTPAGRRHLTLEACRWRRIARAIALVTRENANERGTE